VENIKKVLIEHLGAMYNNKDCAFIVCGFISLNDDDNDTHTVRLIIDADIDEFLDKLDFDIHPLRESFEGIIWYADGTWSEYIYDMEWGTGEWIRFACPEIPETLHKKGE
jgi:hypothetical protein